MDKTTPSTSAQGPALNPLALEALENNQRQLDMDGVEVGVSRQALDELLTAYKAAVERINRATDAAIGGIHRSFAATPSPAASPSGDAKLCPHAPIYDAGLCCGHPDDCTFVSPSSLASDPTPAPTSGPEDGGEHADDIAVDTFAAAMKAKLAKKRAEGRGGWEDKEVCSHGYLSQLLVEHVKKGDPVDIGNLAMMLHQRGEDVADDRERYIAKVQRDRHGLTEPHLLATPSPAGGDDLVSWIENLPREPTPALRAAYEAYKSSGVAAALSSSAGPAVEAVATVRKHIVALGAGCCTCGTKSSDIQMHMEYCKVWNVAHALDALDDLTAAHPAPATVEMRGALDNALAWMSMHAPYNHTVAIRAALAPATEGTDK